MAPIHTTQRNPRLLAALAHARHGRPVIPVYWARGGRCGCGSPACASPAKHPIAELAPSGVKNAMTSSVLIRAAWTHAPEANVAMATGAASGVTVLDVDGDKGGYASLSELEREHGPLPRTQRVTTGRGEHIYLKYPGIHLKNTAGKLAPGLDIRCCGGYVVTVGAEHPSGVRYQWAAGCRPDEAPLADVPRWLVDLLTASPQAHPQVHETGRPSPYALAALDDEVRKLGRAAVGSRNSQLNSAAFSLGQLVAGGELTRDQVEARLLDAALSIGLSQREAERTLRSGLEAGHQHPRVVTDGPVDTGAPSQRPGPVREHEAIQEPTLDPPWPTPINDAAFIGPIGRFIRAIEPYTEADAAALFAHTLSGTGALLGASVHAVAGDAEHPPRLNCVVVGETSKGRKGSAARPVERSLKLADETFAARITEGLSSGEGLIWAVRDPILKPERTGRGAERTVELVETDPGVADKRLWVLESEFASVLRVAQRDGNTLTAVVRRAWDSGDLRTLTKTSPAVATGAHIGITGHISRDELLRYLDRSELASGFANRFLWFAARRGRLLPHGDQVPREPLQDYARAVREAQLWSAARRRLSWTEQAASAWSAIYGDLSAGKPGMLGAATSRAEAQVLRTSVLYAALDRAELIEPEHLLASLAIWEYVASSARWIFGDATGDTVADAVLAALRRQGELTRWEIFELFGRNMRRARIDRGLALLLTAGLARTSRRDTGGRPAEVWHAR